MVSTLPVYIISIVFAGVFILFAALISNAIKYEGGANPKDPGKRKLWFWVMAILGSFANLLFGMMSYYYPENNSYAKSQLITAIGIGTGLCFVLYVVIGFALSKMFKNGKLGNWF
jgi:hypothetical protein